MIAYVVAESRFDVELLRRLLDEGLRRDVEFIEGSGIDGVTSMARTLISHYRRPIAIVIDADASQEEAVRTRRQSMEEVVGSVAGRIPVGVIVAVPEIEIIFFEAPGLLQRLYPNSLPPTILEMASLSTRRAIKMLDPSASLQSFRQRVLMEMTDEDIASLRETSVLRELSGFLRKVQERESQATGSRVVS
jgi:hypothetical protein